MQRSDLHTNRKRKEQTLAYIKCYDYACVICTSMMICRSQGGQEGRDHTVEIFSMVSAENYAHTKTKSPSLYLASIPQNGGTLKYSEISVLSTLIK